MKARRASGIFYDDDGVPVLAADFAFPGDDEAETIAEAREAGRREGAELALAMIGACALGQRVPRKLTARASTAIARRLLIALKSLGFWTVDEVKSFAHLARLLGVTEASVCKTLKKIRRDMTEAGARVSG